MYLCPKSIRHIVSVSHFSALNSIGINDDKEYRDGISWFGNSSLDGITIFESVTYNLSDLINSIEIRYQNGDSMTVLSEDFDTLDPEPRTITNQKYGRCYELMLFNNNRSLFYVQVKLRRDLEIYVNLPYHFYATSRPRIIATVKERLYLQVTYEILKMNYDQNCKKYSKSFAGSYDNCKASDMEKKIQSKFNCTVPFVMKSSNLCMGPVAEEASEMFDEYFETENFHCPQTCDKMITTFSMPKHKPETNKNKVKARIYFNSIVKVTEDFISYNLLR